MNRDYSYALDQCDVQDKRRLEQYRAKRSVWLSWLETDDYHSIWSTLHSMVWTDVAFRCLTAFASSEKPSALHNRLLAEALINGHFATQILAIRRLADAGGGDVISLRRLLKDIKAHGPLLTREHYVCHDGLPYDFARVQYEEMSTLRSKGGGAFWAATTGQTAWHASQRAHEQFDRLSGADPGRRSRGDIVSASIFSTIETWLNESGASELGKWSSTFLAHAGGPTSRMALADYNVTADRISGAIRSLARVAEALGAYVLWASGRSHALMPVAQFDPFEGLDSIVITTDQAEDAQRLWEQLSDAHDGCLSDVDRDLFGANTGKKRGPT